MSNIYFMCENCGKETNGITFVNGMKFCAKCYQETFGKDNQQNEIQQLKQQLAEKDKEIASLQVLIIENKNDIKEMREFKIGDNEYDLTDEDARNDIKNQLENQTQLAIRELEKVKELLLDEYKKYPIVYDKTNDIVAGALDRDKVNEIIDQQIKELKGEKDVKD